MKNHNTKGTLLFIELIAGFFLGNVLLADNVKIPCELKADTHAVTTEILTFENTLSPRSPQNILGAYFQDWLRESCGTLISQRLAANPSGAIEYRCDITNYLIDGVNPRTYSEFWRIFKTASIPLISTRPLSAIEQKLSICRKITKCEVKVSENISKESEKTLKVLQALSPIYERLDCFQLEQRAKEGRL